ncbi:MAG: 50S ribosomal protein L10 [Parachlamydiaceae bacterium]|nr:50S ribosomal protein L10 [Parachlamydiaceae bacterium]
MRPEKELLKNEIKSKFNHYGSFVIVNYVKFSANAANAFRRQIRKLGGELEVVRKRVLVKAAEDVGVSLDQSFLTGHVGLVFLGEDPIETTKAVFAFAGEGEKAINVVGGQFDGKIYNGVDVKRLSELPGKDEMRAQLLSVLEAPLSHTLSVMAALLTSVPYCLDNKVKLETGE